MKLNELAQLWESTASGQMTESEYHLKLPVEDAAKLEALCELYPKRTKEQLLTDLLSAALEDVEKSLPYVPGKTVVATDEMGDPLYEDVGPTPKYLSLSKKHLQRLRSTLKPSTNH
ncbi:type 1 pili tip component [Marinibactrum halimedae]|uniref:Type 1 pili tip component n=1 Tax=Marinibactrum halimedae TaxID=1444977 RepID=A0AA37T4X8_9GAMM|nr:type 1 pili tip component [Marinibactrum halimedae]MCD9459192.1 type 1 pili tip component [Marinibactrum halimedae]GLS27263.1 hypothetical protein GCM10007877_29820 [Marinibactrum halimedae]